MTLGGVFVVGLHMLSAGTTPVRQRLKERDSRCSPFFIGEKMSKKTYVELLRDPRWQKKRLEILASADWQCEICSDDESTLHIHHKEYFSGRDIWDYERNQLACLCSSCHEAYHSSKDLLKQVCSTLNLDGPMNRSDAAYLLAGFLGVDLAPTCEMHQRLLTVGSNAASLYWEAV